MIGAFCHLRHSCTVVGTPSSAQCNTVIHRTGSSVQEARERSKAQQIDSDVQWMELVSAVCLPRFLSLSLPRTLSLSLQHQLPPPGRFDECERGGCGGGGGER